MKKIYTALASLVFAGSLLSQQFNTTEEGITYTPNRGQIVDTDLKPRPDILYTTSGNGMKVYMRTTGISYVFEQSNAPAPPSQNMQPGATAAELEMAEAKFQEEMKLATVNLYRVDVNFIGANANPQVINENPTDSYNNYYLAQCPDGILNVHSFGRVTYKDVYPGIDMVLYSKEGQMKYDFIVHPGADPSQIQLQVDGTDNWFINSEGGLQIETSLGTILEEAPYTYQGGNKIESTYIRDRNTIRFSVGNFDRSKDLIVDPTRIWSTYVGGSNYEEGYYGCDISSFGSNEIYHTIISFSTNYPSTVGAFQTTLAGGRDNTIFKFNGAGTRVWATYMGGSSDEYGSSITNSPVDGSVIFQGTTISNNFPVSAGCYDNSYNGGYDRYIARFTPAGARIWSTYFGGSSDEYYSGGLACDANGNIGFSFSTYSTNIPMVGSSFQIVNNGNQDWVVAKFSPTGLPVWTTYYGGAGTDRGNGQNSLAFDSNNNMIVAGMTYNSGFPVSVGCYDNSWSGGWDLVWVKFSPTGSRLYGTFLGGTSDDFSPGSWNEGASVSIDYNNNDIVIAGASSSFDFPVTTGALQTTKVNGWDGTISKFTNSGSMIWSTYYGGSGDDWVRGVEIDTSGAIIFVMGIYSSGLPVTNDAYDATYNGNWDIYIGELSPGGLFRTYATYYGGPLYEMPEANSLTLADDNGIYFCGVTDGNSNQFPTTIGAFQTANQGAYDGVVYKFDFCKPSMGDLGITGDAAICQGDTVTYFLIEGANRAGSYTWSLPSGGTIIAGANTDSVTVAYSVAASSGNVQVFGSNACGNSDTLVLAVTVNPLPNTTYAAPITTTCINSGAFTLTGGSPSGGVYSGAGVTGGIFFPSAAGIGSHTITYTYTTAFGCVKPATQTITVNPLPSPTISGLSASYCQNASAVTMTGNPSGGTFSGPGVTANTFNPSTVGAGTHSITYTYTDGGGCTGSVSQSVVVNPLPTVTFAAQSGVCVNGSSFSLSGGSPAGGNYSGPGVSAGVFNPSSAGVGVHTLTYSYTNGNGCTNTASTTIQVYALPTVTFSSMSPVCVNASPFTLLNGSPSGGTYSGPGVSGSTFYPSTAGVGTHTLNYSYTNGNGCSASTTQTIVVNALPTVTLNSFTPVCVNAAPFTLTGGSPVGGIYSGTGVSGGVFTPSNAGAGSFTIAYSFTDGSGCSNSATQTITVNPLPTVSMTSLAPVCANDAPVTLTAGSPAGGTYSGTGVTGGMFDPSVAGVGNHLLTYTYTNGNGCSASATQTIAVNSLPTVTLNTFSAVCVTSTSFTLTGGNPGGGTYSGPGVSGGVFDPSLAGAGTHTITYSFTNASGCTNTAMQSIVVNALPVVTVNASSPTICEGDATTLTAGGASTYVWSTSATTSAITVNPAATTSYSVTGIDANGCSTSASFVVNVNALPVVSISGANAFCAGGADTLFANGAVSYLWSTTETSDSIIVNPTSTTSYTVTGTDGNGCMNTATVNIVVNSLPMVTATANNGAVCIGNSDILTANGATSYVWSSGGTNSTETVAPVSSATYTVTGTDVNGCSDSATVAVTVNALPVITASIAMDTVCAGTEDTLMASGGVTYGWNFGGTNAVEAVNPTMSSVYIVTGTDANGCQNSDSVSVFVNALPVLIVTADSSVICNGEMASLFVSGADLYSWSSGGTDSVEVVMPNATATYTVTGTDSIGCQNSATVTVIVYQLPVISVSASNPEVCPGGSSSISATGAATYAWDFGGVNSTEIVTPSSTATYTVVGTDVNGCSDSSTVIVIVNTNPNIAFTALPNMCIQDVGVQLNATPTGGTFTGLGVVGNYFYPQLAGTGTHVITYEVSDSSGCYSVDSMNVVVSECVGITESASSNGDVNVYPNPFVEQTTVEVLNAKRELLTLNIYDVSGKIVQTYSGNTGKFTVERGDLADGVYFYQVLSNDAIIGTGKMIIGY